MAIIHVLDMFKADLKCLDFSWENDKSCVILARKLVDVFQVPFL